MDVCETDTHSFIIRLWLEETVEEAGQTTWRGHITHIPSRQRQYMDQLEQIIQFITPYLQNLGVEVDRG